GIMEEIDRWVLQSACSSIFQWTRDGLLRPGQTVSVNISGKEFNSATFVDDVQAALRKTGANPAFLGIEITEGSLISTGTEMIGRITTLRDMGINFSIDDFGTGYSSLSYLQTLPLNTLKIDRSFVNTIGSQLENVVLVDTIIMMAHNLGLDVIAEGVESKRELDYLNNRGCRKYQGYYFSKPLSPQNFTELLSNEVEEHLL
ncbi:MAG: EAL domain-containing protein, partial [Desulfopila sp.]